MKFKTLKNLEVKKVLNSGNVIKSKNFLVVYQKSEDRELKVAFIVSKKISKRAVDRNRVKRILREALRLLLKKKEDLKNQNLNLVIIANRSLLKKKLLIL